METGGRNRGSEATKYERDLVNTLRGQDDRERRKTLSKRRERLRHRQVGKPTSGRLELIEVVNDVESRLDDVGETRTSPQMVGEETLRSSRGPEEGRRSSG